MSSLVIWCADIGSVKNKRFGWCKGIKIENKFEFSTGTDIVDFAEGIADDLAKGNKVALGFECPLFIPISKNSIQLTSARQGEGDRA